MPAPSSKNSDISARPQAQDRPSDRWPPIDNLQAGKRSERVKQIISHGNWSFLCAEAVRHNPTSGVVTCTANLTRLASGTFNVVFELSFSNNTFWVARIRIWDDGDFETEMLSEIATLMLVKERTSMPIPTVYTYNCHEGNAFGFPYMLMSTLPGKHLDDPFAFSVPEEFKPKVADKLAQYVWELSQITFDHIGRIWCNTDLDEKHQIISFPMLEEDIGPFNSSRAYFFGLRQAINDAIYDKHSNDSD